MTNDIQKYIACMEEIKRRTAIITDFLEKKKITGYLMTDVEFICLQFRKLRELIALSSLCANRKKFEEMRSNFHKEWDANKILKTLERINPRFYPCASKQIIDAKTRKVIETKPVKDGFLRREELPRILWKCGEFLHAFNPYSHSQVPAPEALWKTFREWLRKVMTLLNHHQTQLVDSRMQLWVVMQAAQDGKVHVTEMMRIDGDISTLKNGTRR